MDHQTEATDLSFLADGGEAGALIRAFDWRATPIGAPEGWSSALKTAVTLMLGASQPVYVAWGPELTSLYNDGYLPIVGTKHPGIGLPFAELWAEIWDQFRPIVESTMAGEAQHFVDLPIDLAGRPGVPVGYFTFSYTGLRDDEGRMAGFYCAATETTEKVLGERRLRDSEARYREIVEDAEDFAIVTLDEHGTIESWNSGAERITGFAETEAIGHPGEIFFTPADVAAGAPDHEMNRARSDRRAVNERWHQKQDGSRFWGSGLMMRREGADGGYLKIFRDRTAEHEADAAIRTEQERYRALFDAIDAGFCIVEVEFDEGGQAVDHRFIEVNPAFERQTGLANAAGRRASEIAPGIEQRWHEAYGKVARTGEAVRFEEHAEPLDRWFDVYVFPAGAPGENRAAALFNDISQRRRAEERLRDLNATLETQVAARTAERDRIWQVSRDLLGVADGAGVWLSVNPAWTQTLGWNAEEIVERTSAWLEHPDDGERTRAEVARLAQGQATLAFENRFRTRAGDYRDLAWTAVPVEDRLYCVARDVTADKAQQAELLRTQGSLRLYEHIVQSDPAPVCAFDADYRLVGFNQAHSDAFFRIFGRRVAVGEVFPDLFPPDQARIMRSFMARALAGESYTVVEAFGDPDLAKPCWEVNYTPLRDAAGKVDGAFHHARDISDRLRAQTELEATQEALRQAQKMEAVGQLTGGLAHDFNNLLTGMMGNLELLQLRVARGRVDDLDRFVNAAQGAGRRAASLTQRLLAFSRRQTLDPKPTDVNRLIVGFEELLHRTVGATVDIEIVQAAGLWTAEIDASQLENAIINLCINGRDAMPEGGKLTIETANKWIDDRTGRERDLQPGQYISICVTDTGTGMSAETIERAFEPFYTTKPIGQGTGLGLSMIYGFARQSGGQVRIYSELGQGTTVCVYLPRHHGEAQDGEADMAASLAESTAGQTVLVVDDEATIRHLIDEVLDDLGYTVIGAADGAAGIKVLQSGARIELLITDVGLPNGMNGRQVADEARRLRPGLKVLFITGFAENAAVGNGHLEPGMELLTKPFTLEALSGKVAAMLSRTS